MLVCFKEPRKLVVLFDHVGWPHFLRDEIVDMEEHTIHVLIHIPEVNGTLEPTDCRHHGFPTARPLGLLHHRRLPLTGAVQS
jgi:hypothetical protein